ncbi:MULTISPECIES: alpha/beta fold hydrolase [Flavobacteriaceae]|uniref:Alpha/beta fold hydrolase n=2 Tax=Flavobacteriaceae TaxID=49546 RepID=A0A4Y8APA0_9FLAO|nr:MULTISPECIES: alpha/beta fold hydrolase [Flavobacteriaceae]TEW72465.1 alpha/beta fold hydrolase [Gramella jeungdoensis]GGK55548.1 alpha/beta hydrolase [Lutibacter litoralis]
MILHSKIQGTGSPLLILHGYFGMGDNWKSLANKFAETFEVHLIDQRNHGRSFHAYDFDYELLVEDLFKYIQHHNLEKVNLLGHSMGGKVAMLFSVTFPEFVDKLIVADISPKYYKPHHQQILAALNAVNFQIQNTRSKIEDTLKIYIKDRGILLFLLKNVYRKSKDTYAFRFNLESLTVNNSEVGAALPSYTEFDGETLFLSGENSNYITENEVDLIAEHFPNSKIITVKNAGHWLHAENPTQFYNEVISFLS